jgi:hypothetical protein
MNYSRICMWTQNKKLIILHTGSFRGVISCTQLAFKANFISFDYHGQINLINLEASLPRHNLKRGNYLSLLQSFPGKFIIGGDFNSKHISLGSRLTRRATNSTKPSRNVIVTSTPQENLPIGRLTWTSYRIWLISLCQKTYLPVSLMLLKNSTSTPIIRQ